MKNEPNNKILDLDSLADALKSLRDAGRTIVHCHGCFDIVHPGHIRYLEFARRQGDVLVVSIAGDSAVADGGLRPYMPQDLRAENLAALMVVDFVTIVETPTARDLLDRVRPDVYVKGREYENSTDPGFLSEKHIVEQNGGRIIFSSGETLLSSTDLIDRLQGNAQHGSEKLGIYCRRHEIDIDSLQELMSRFKSLNVMVVGDIVLDRYVHCDALGVASESPVLSLVERDCSNFIGGAAVVARHIAALGGQASLLSSVARGAECTLVEEACAKEGIESHLIDSRPDMVVKTRFLADDSKVLKVEKAQCCPLDSVAEKQAAAFMAQQAKQADAVIFCDFGYGMITGSLLSRVIPMLRQNVPVMTADVSGGRANLLHFKNADLLCPTEREVRAMLNDYESGLSAVAWNLLERTGARHLIITLEKRGVLVFERRSQDRMAPEWSGRLMSDQIPTFAEHVVDRLGCGDALLAAATLTLAAGDSLARAAYLGNAAAAREIALLGNHPVSRSDVEEWMKGRPELHTCEPPINAPSKDLVAKDLVAKDLVADGMVTEKVANSIAPKNLVTRK